MSPQYLAKQLQRYRSAGNRAPIAQDATYRMLSHMAGEISVPGVNIAGRLQQWEQGQRFSSTELAFITIKACEFVRAAQ